MSVDRLSRRRMLAGGLAARAPTMAGAQFANKPSKPVQDENFVTVPASIEEKARPIASFDPRDKAHVRFCSLEWRSGLVLTSAFPGFGGLSALRLDPKGERFVSLSDKGSWFTGRIVYNGREMTGLADVEVAPMLGADGRPITARGWFDSESLAFDGEVAYVGLERVNQVLRFDFAKGFTRAK